MTAGPLPQPAPTGASLRPDGVLTARSPDDLSLIHRAGVDLVRWDRTLPQALPAWLDGLADGTLPHVRFSAPLGAVEPAAVAAFESAGIGPSVARHLLVADIVLLAMLYSHVEQSEWLSIRLERIDHDACRKPHIDRVTTRLLCTYRGDGTEFGRAGDDPETWRCDLALGRFEVGLVKGLLHPTQRASAAAPLLHRSPRFTAESRERFLLCIGAAHTPLAPERAARTLH
ncbi:DUF1826 domain-containing protein [Thalassobaculum sp. OXR-137]|uniref:DUF1826 domain-containing protein n=1 Tax=Thalassobaculum sp. OXR-137 TaxID=3100173 RepID=UPI002AC9774C|nr:DUF1826 domain-containing protein [Thalassobaculum sp. OXR-137]WPZ34410.1 DUF1826 domain-containing protein [Thalassobaculum sp. OXR-137]